MTETITIRLSKKLQKELENLARLEKTSRSELIRKAVLKYITLKKFKSLRKQVLPFAEAEGLLTDEDIFKSIS